MSDFLGAALSFPTVVFTVAVLICAGYWLVAVIFGLGLEGGDAGLDSDGGLDGVLDGGGVLATLGLTSVPPAVAISLVAVFAWFVSLVGTVVLDALGASGVALVALGLAVALAAVVLGSLVAALAARPLARLYVADPPNRLADFIGKPCVIHTKTVTESFGMAQVTDREGTSLLLQVRADPAEQLTLGDTALVFDYDQSTGTFNITRNT